MIRNREYTKALLSARQARTISREFRIPFEAVCRDRQQLLYNKEKRREDWKRRSQMRRELLQSERTHIDTKPFSFDMKELDARQRDEYSVKMWASLDIRYENEPKDPPFNLPRAIINSQRLMRARPQRHSYAGVSSIYETQGMDFHAGSKAA